MRRRGITLAALTIVTSLGASSIADDPPVEKSFTLMGILSEWLYPDAKFHGAESSDAAVRDISSIKSKALLATPDPVDKVVAYYLEKLKVDAAGTNLGQKDGQRITTRRSVSIQDNSDDRPLKLAIIAVNETGNSTTLVISRAENEKTTHIAWSNFRQLWP